MKPTSSTHPCSPQIPRFRFRTCRHPPTPLLFPPTITAPYNYIPRDGVTIIYEGAVDSVIGRPPPSAGTPVIVADGARRPLAWGVFNPASQYRVRVMQTAPECLADPSLAVNLEATIRRRVTEAVALRKSMGLPGPDANVFRLINSGGWTLHLQDLALLASRSL